MSAVRTDFPAGETSLGAAVDSATSRAPAPRRGVLDGGPTALRIPRSTDAEVTSQRPLGHTGSETVFQTAQSSESFVSAGPNPGASYTKRALDVFSSVLLLVLFMPFMVLIALCVWATSPGGPFFVQERVGRGGKHFRLYKFRTMRQGTFDEVMSTPHLKAVYEANGFKLPGNDSHVTSIGRVLRKTSLDELPQLWNVLRGEMSLVGIRPLVPAEFEERPAADRAAYEKGRPGLTGLWQVAGRSAVSGDNRIALDREYIDSWALWRDAVILVRTPLALLRVDRSA